jgi:hypothetical protein
MALHLFAFDDAVFDLACDLNMSLNFFVDLIIMNINNNQIMRNEKQEINIEE